MRIAIISIFVENKNEIEKVNAILHEYSNFVYGRLGLPKIKENLNVICLVVKASGDDISSMTGKLGNLNGVSAKATYAKEN
ncbi:MAG: TM1266 family iron-only hydrogenase system putative regulator [Peptoniphilaceae bacterium]|nr:iron-only hydrogenase system regulator [Peptoniphilaceae bacterium]MDY3738593.1 TM1266 family iron-only hydrogenase system putative regulator [Peptoniphilaceae bacterium]